MDQSTCEVEECTEAVHCRKVCRQHYNRDYYRRTLGAEIESRRAADRAAHVAPTHKQCTGCLIEKPMDEFRKCSRNKTTGREPRCKSCQKDAYIQNPESAIANAKRYYSANREKVLAQKKARYDADPSFFLAKSAESHARHKEARNAAAAQRRANPDYAERARIATSAWRAENAERAKESARAYRERNPELVARRLREWHEKNPDKVKAARVRRRDLVRGARRIDFSGEELNARLDFFGYRCWMCGGPYEHLDHVKPLSKGGATMLANLRPSCQPCNLSKKDKWFGVAGLHRFKK